MFSKVPQPPFDMKMGATAQAIFTVGQFLPFIILTIVAIRWSRQRKTPIPLLFIVGGGLAIFLEPVVDVLGLCFFPRHGQWRLFEAFGRPIPLFLVVYFWYVGGQGMLAWRRFEEGVTKRDVWRLYAIFMIVNVILESPGIWMNIYTYYGKQPFDFWGFPLWWAPINAGMPIVAAALVYRLRPYLTGWRVLGVAALVPMADGLTNGASAWPTWVALNTQLPSAVTWTAGAVTCGLAAFLVWIVTLAVSRREIVVIASGLSGSDDSFSAPNAPRRGWASAPQDAQGAR
jgi:hypothetical protein